MANFMHQWLSRWWARKALRSMHRLQKNYLAYVTALPHLVTVPPLSPADIAFRRQVVEKAFKAILDQSAQFETSQAVRAFSRKCKAFARDPWAYSLQITDLENE